MNKQEIQALIDAKIAGQGSAIDVGGALPTILHEILEMAAGGENVQSNWDETDNQSPQYIQNKPNIPAPYSLPVASAETLGGVKVGDNLSIDPATGALSAAGGRVLLDVQDLQPAEDDYTETTLAAAFGISVEQLRGLFDGRYSTLCSGALHTTIGVVTYCKNPSSLGVCLQYYIYVVDNTDLSLNISDRVVVSANEDGYSLTRV